MTNFDHRDMLTRIHNLFADAGYTDIAKAFKKLEITGSFSDWQRKPCNPSLDALLKMSESFNVSIDYIVYGDEIKAPIRQEVVSPQDKQLIEKLSQLPYDSRAVLTAYLDGLLQMYKMKK